MRCAGARRPRKERENATLAEADVGAVHHLPRVRARGAVVARAAARPRVGRARNSSVCAPNATHHVATLRRKSSELLRVQLSAAAQQRRSAAAPSAAALNWVAKGSGFLFELHKIELRSERSERLPSPLLTRIRRALRPFERRTLNWVAATKAPLPRLLPAPFTCLLPFVYSMRSERSERLHVSSPVRAVYVRESAIHPIHSPLRPA